MPPIRQPWCLLARDGCTARAGPRGAVGAAVGPASGRRDLGRRARCPCARVGPPLHRRAGPRGNTGEWVPAAIGRRIAGCRGPCFSRTKIEGSRRAPAAACTSQTVHTAPPERLSRELIHRPQANIRPGYRANKPPNVGLQGLFPHCGEGFADERSRKGSAPLRHVDSETVIELGHERSSAKLGPDLSRSPGRERPVGVSGRQQDGQLAEPVGRVRNQPGLLQRSSRCRRSTCYVAGRQGCGPRTVLTQEAVRGSREGRWSRVRGTSATTSQSRARTAASPIRGYS